MFWKFNTEGDIMTGFGNYLKRIRKGKMTQRELASKVGVGYPYISKIENNIEAPPSDEVLTKISHNLDVDIDEVYLKAKRIPKDIKQSILRTPKLFKFLRHIKEDEMTMFLLENFKDLIKHKEKLYWNLFNDSNEVMLLIDPDTFQIAKANEAAIRFYGYSSGKYKNMKITEINTLSEQEVYEEMKKAKLKMRNCFNFKHRLNNEKIVDVEVKSSPIIIGKKTFLNSVIHSTPCYQKSS